MKKFAVRCFLSLFACALGASSVAKGDQNVVTFYLTTPRYYVDGNVIWEDATSGLESPIKGECGAFPCYKGFTTSSGYYCNSASGYYASAWKLVTPGISGNKEVQTWGSQSSITVTFDYDWASEYGTQLELIAYVNQMGYTLEYDANGGDWTAGEPEGGEYKYFDAVTAPSGSSVGRESYVFDGWKSDGGSLINPGAEFKGDSLGVTKNGQTVTLYAQWTAATYSVTLNKDGGTVAKGKDVTSYTYGTAVTLPTLTKASYTFDGWYDNPQFSGSVVTKISKTDTGDREFWAKWTWSPKQYKVTLNKNGGTVVEGEDLTSYTYGVGATLPILEKANYTFGNWYANRKFSGDPVTEITATDTGNKTFYAQWTANQYTVTLNKEDGEIAKGKDVTNYTYGTAVTLPTLKKDGYTFAGWYDNPQFSGSVVTKISKTDTGDREFWSKWTANQYKVTLNKKGGTIAEGENVTSYTYGVGATLPTLEKANYAFGGWYDNSQFSGNAVTEITATDMGKKTFYARWLPAEYKYSVTLNKEGGEIDKGTDVTGYAYGVEVTLPTLKKDGFVFAGWYDNPLYSGSNVVTKISATDKGDKEFWAKWVQSQYNVTLNANGGTIAEGTEVTNYAYGVGATLPLATKANYSFEGWYDNPLCADSNAVTKITATDTGDKEFWAKWTQMRYAVKLVLPKGAAIDGTTVTSYTVGVGVTLPLATKTGSEFIGWYDNPLLSGDAITAISATDTGDKKFWASFSTTIHYDGNGATDGSMDDTPFVVNRSVKFAKNAFARVFTVTYDANGGTTDATSDEAEYSFKNWNSQSDGLGEYTYDDARDVTNPCGSTGEAVTLYAQWQPESVTVTLPDAQNGDKPFLGWFTAQFGGIRVGGAGDTYAPTWNVKLYAHWGTTKYYTVRFSPGAEMSDEEAEAMTNLTFVSGQTFALPACDYPTPLAYTRFVGWTRNGEIYEVGDAFTYGVVNDGDEVLFRAVWDTSDLSKAVGLEGVAALTNAVEGDGWTVSKGTGVSGGDCVMSGGSGGSMVMVVRGAGKLSFSHKGDAGVLWMDGAPLTIASSEDWTDYATCQFDGDILHEIIWEPSESATEEIYVGNVKWKPDVSATYEISATVNPLSAGTVTGGCTANFGETVTLTATANEGYAFVCWSDGDTNASRAVTVTCTESYQAIFSGGKTETPYYYVLFDGNGADNMSAMDGQQIAVGVPTALVANKFTRSGYSFNHWGTTRSGATTTYEDAATVTDLAAEDKTITLYAIWEVDETESDSDSYWEDDSDTDSDSDTDAESEAGEDSGTGTGSESGTGTDPDPGTGTDPVEERVIGVYTNRVGEVVSFDLLADYPNIKSVSGLPSGLKYNKNTGLVTGTPTRAVDKTDNVKLTFTDKTKTNVTWRVVALPEMMVGTYYGRAYVDSQAGQFQLKLTATGKATGYFYALGKKVSFKSATLAYESDGRYVVSVTYTYNSVKRTDTICLTRDATVAGVKGDVDLWFASVGESAVLEDIDAERYAVKEVFGTVKAETVSVLEKNEDGEYLTAKITTAGVVKVSGKLLSDADKLVSVSCSTYLLVSEDKKEYFYVTIYKTVSNSDPIVVDEIVE